MDKEDFRKLRIFVASPSDVASERAKLETVVSSLKPMADYLGLLLEVVDWRAVVPDAGRPQQIIFDQLHPSSWDVFIGILWHRFGTPPGGKDLQTQKNYLSGTEEEFHVAYRLNTQFNKPRIVLYRCTRPIPVDADLLQAQRVKDFFKAVQDPEGEYRVLTQSFDSLESFEKLIVDNLQKLLIEYGVQLKMPFRPEMGQVYGTKIPNNLPRRTQFFGRKKEIKEAMRALSPDDRGWGVVIDGIGGIGKTALAIEMALLCKEQGKFDAFIFVSAKRDRLEPQGIQEMTPAATTLDTFVNEIALAFGQPGIARLAGEQKSAALLETLRGAKALLILDNLETLTTAEQSAIGNFLRNLPPDCKAIVTSRRRMDEAAVTIRLERMQWEEARQLIANEMTRHPDVQRVLLRVGEAGWKQLYDEAGGSPLALMWTIGLIRARGLRFEDALKLLSDGSTESELNAFIYREAKKRMDENERIALGAMSFFGSPANYKALLTASNLTPLVLNLTLERLRALSFVDVVPGVDGEDCYTLHPLTRRFASHDLTTKDSALEHTIGMRFARFWVNYASQYGGYDKESYKTYYRLESEWANIAASANWLYIAALKGSIVGEDSAGQLLNTLADIVGQFLWFSGRRDEQVHMSTRAYEAMVAMKQWNKAGWRAYDVAWIHYNREHTDSAAMWADHCAEAWERNSGKREQATLAQIRGYIEQQRKNYKEAEHLLQEVLSMDRSYGSQSDIAADLSDLGNLSFECRDYITAEKYFRDALELALASGSKERQVSCLGDLGKLALFRKELSEAQKWFSQALPLAKEVGLQEGIAQAQYGLARVLEAHGEVDSALTLAQEAVLIYERLRHKNLMEARELVEKLHK